MATVLKLKGWLTRDKNGDLVFHSKKPKKYKDYWISTGGIMWQIDKEDDKFSNIKFEDDAVMLTMDINITIND